MFEVKKLLFWGEMSVKEGLNRQRRKVLGPFVLLARAVLRELLLFVSFQANPEPGKRPRQAIVLNDGKGYKSSSIICIISSIIYQNCITSLVCCRCVAFEETVIISSQASFDLYWWIV